MERRPAPTAPANPLRRRGQYRLAGPGLGVGYRREGQVTGSRAPIGMPVLLGVRPPLAGASRSDEALDGRPSPEIRPKRGEHDDPTAVRPRERRGLAAPPDGGGVLHLPDQPDPV